VQDLNDKPRWLNVSHGLIRVLVPIVLILTSIRLVLITARTWVRIEYNLPGFPEDPYGFTLDDRLYWSEIDIDYLLSDAGLEYFETFRLDDGSPMHNARELRHMEDVKILIGRVWMVWGVGLILIVTLSLVLWRTGDAVVAWRALLDGSKLTMVLMALIGLGTLFTFGILFVGFHRIFFEGNTWLFLPSDTFIRLYPERFWRDTFIFLGVVTVIEAFLVYLASRYFLGRIEAEIP
jgi:integral membrane protein (TIGR01906 family)